MFFVNCGMVGVGRRILDSGCDFYAAWNEDMTSVWKAVVFVPTRKRIAIPIDASHLLPDYFAMSINDKWVDGQMIYVYPEDFS